jgi:hypothetical protein
VKDGGERTAPQFGTTNAEVVAGSMVARSASQNVVNFIVPCLSLFLVATAIGVFVMKLFEKKS